MIFFNIKYCCNNFKTYIAFLHQVKLYDSFRERVLLREIADDDVGWIRTHFFGLEPLGQEVVARCADGLLQRRERMESHGADGRGQDTLRNEQNVRVPVHQPLVEVFGQRGQLHGVRPGVRAELPRPQEVFSSCHRRVDHDDPVSVAEHRLQAEHGSVGGKGAELVRPEVTFDERHLGKTKQTWVLFSTYGDILLGFQESLELLLLPVCQRLIGKMGL